MKINSKKLTYIILVIILTTTTVIGCAGPASTNPPLEDQHREAQEDMREIVDMAGRKVEIGGTIERVYCTSPIGTIAAYTLEPDKLVGWNYELSPKEKQFIPSKYHDLPVLGGWFSKNTGNNEEILKVAPDVIIHMSPINETEISLADRIQEQLKIPVIVLDEDLEKTPETYLFLGEVLDNQDRAKIMADYCKDAIDEVTAKAQTIPEDDKVKVYYAEGPDGLETDPKGSSHTKVLDMVGGINVAQVQNQSNAGRLSVSIEQLLLWDPEIIISWDPDRGGYYEGILQDKAWKNIKAVQVGEVYSIPNQPFSWFDRPFSVNRILGLKWLSNLLYPEVFGGDIIKEVKNYYELFYHHNLTNDELHTLLKNAKKQD